MNRVTGPVIPIRAGSGPDPRRLGAEDWARGSTFLEFVDASGALRPRIESAFRAAAPNATEIAFAASVERTIRITAVAARGDFEAAANIAHAEKLVAAGKHLWLRVFDPETTGDLTARFLPGVDLASSHFGFFVEDGRGCARWGPRPAALQARCDASPAATHAAIRDAYYAASDGRELAGEWCILLRDCIAGAPLAPRRGH